MKKYFNFWSVSLPIVSIVVIWVLFSFVKESLNIISAINLIKEENLKKTLLEIKNNIDISIGYLQLLLSIIAAILSFFFGNMLNLTRDVATTITSIKDSSQTKIEENSQILVSTQEQMNVNNQVLNSTISFLNDNKEIIKNFPHIDSLILSKQKVSTLDRDGIIAILCKPIEAPLIDYEFYRPCVGVIDVIMLDTFQFQDLILCKTYMKYLITRSRSIADTKWKYRLIVANENDLFIKSGRILPIFESYIQITEALGYRNYLVDEDTYNELCEELLRKNIPKGYNIKVTDALKMQPSITFGLNQTKEPNKDLAEYKARCDFQNLNSIGKSIKKLNQAEAKLAALFLMGFLQDLNNQLKSDKLDLRRTYKAIKSNRGNIVENIIKFNNKYVL